MAALCCGLLVLSMAAATARAEGGAAAAPERLELEVRAGQILRMDRPVTAVFVADPEIADVQAHSPTMVYVFGKKTGTTTVFAVDQDEDVVLQRTVQVVHPLARLRQTMQRLLPEEDVEVASLDGAIVLSGEVSSSSMAMDAAELAQTFLGEQERLVNRLVIQSPTQVNLRVRVAEIAREADRIFGVNWDAALSVGDSFFNLVTGRDFLGANRQTFTRFVDQLGPTGGLLGGFANDTFAVDGIIDALEREGLVAVLAEPNLTALSGETASFLAGGEFPVPVGRKDDEITIEFKEFGVRLSFTPTVLNSERISLQVKPEVSDLDFANAIELADTLIPALKTRRAETTIELGSGQSFAIGGLISNTSQNNVEKFPGLGDLPILGTLFRSTNFQRSQSELVIIVTPYLVKPTRLAELRSPTDDYVPPNDLERILEGRLTKPRLTPGVDAPRVAGTKLLGAAGFALD